MGASRCRPPGIVGALAYASAHAIGGTPGASTIFVVLAGCAAAFFLAARRNAVTPSNVNSEWSGSVAPAASRAVAGAAL